MQPLYTETHFSTAKASDLLPMLCSTCNTSFSKSKRSIQCGLSRNYANYFCSSECRSAKMNATVMVACACCNKECTKRPCEIAKVKHVFCSRSCAATYNNTHKTKGTRRSKLEVWLEESLAMLYPQLDILYCDKQAINGELDIYVPSLRLAFELNGIYHYEPIHGQSKLDQVQSNDHRKFQACIEHNIELVIMDTSQLKYFKEAGCLPYLAIIRKIVDGKLANVSQL